MTNIDELEKLGQLYQKKLITKDEFEKQKAALLAVENPSENGAKSQGIYILLALFLGGFGVHNFYAGYYKRAVAQLILTIFGAFYIGDNGSCELRLDFYQHLYDSKGCQRRSV